MAILHGKLLSESEVIEPNNTSLYACRLTNNCGGSSLYSSCLRCVRNSPTLPPPPVQVQVQHKPAENHVIPYLISAAFAVGVAFLILATCTILLRCPYSRSRRRNSSRVANFRERETVFVDEDHEPIIDHPIWLIVTIGLPQSVIDSITAFKYKRCDGLIEGTDCSVCLAEFEEGDDLRLLPKCSHAFHLPCIDTWLSSHKNCPLCRAPVVNDSSHANFPVLSPSLGGLGSSEATQIENSDTLGGSCGDQAGQLGETSQRSNRADDDFDTLPIEGIRIAEILKRNRENRVLSNLGDNCGIMNEDFKPVRRSISLDASAASAISNAILSNVAMVIGEGSSKQERGIGLERSSKQGHRDSSMSRLMKSSSIGHSLQKAPVSMKRSSSSSAKFFSSLRGTKSQPSAILPL